VQFVPRELEAGQESPRLHPATVPPAPPVLIIEPSALPLRPTATPSHGSFLRAAIYAGAIGTLLSTIPLGFVIGVPFAGVVAVRYYKGRGTAPHLTPALGFRLGALSGLFAFGMLVLVRTITTAVFGGGGELRQGMVDRIHQAQATNSDPQVQQMFHYFLTPQGMTVLMLVGLFLMCVMFVLLAGLGGLISASVQRKRGG